MQAIVVIAMSILPIIILYHIIKSAVRNGIIEAHKDIKEEEENNRMTVEPRKTCPNCGVEHDLGYPRCPHCNHGYI